MKSENCHCNQMFLYCVIVCDVTVIDYMIVALRISDHRSMAVPQAVASRRRSSARTKSTSSSSNNSNSEMPRGRGNGGISGSRDRDGGIEIPLVLFDRGQECLGATFSLSQPISTVMSPAFLVLSHQ